MIERGEVHTMDSPKTEWLTRDDIDRVVANLSAEDLIDSGITGTDDKAEATRAGARAFNASAERLGLSNGTPAMAHVRGSDLMYFANALKESLDIDGPKSDDTEDSPPSVSTGE